MDYLYINIGKVFITLRYIALFSRAVQQFQEVNNNRQFSNSYDTFAILLLFFNSNSADEMQLWFNNRNLKYQLAPSTTTFTHLQILFIPSFQKLIMFKCFTVFVSFEMSQQELEEQLSDCQNIKLSSFSLE